MTQFNRIQVDLRISEQVAEILSAVAIWSWSPEMLPEHMTRKHEDATYLFGGNTPIHILCRNDDQVITNRFVCRGDDLLRMLLYTQRPTPELAIALLLAVPYQESISSLRDQAAVHCLNAARFHRETSPPAPEEPPRWDVLHIDGNHYTRGGSVWHLSRSEEDARLINLSTFEAQTTSPDELDLLPLISSFNPLPLPPVGTSVHIYPKIPGESFIHTIEQTGHLLVLRNSDSGTLHQISPRQLFHGGRVLRVAPVFS